jgi:hypothetical protein
MGFAYSSGQEWIPSAFAQLGRPASPARSSEHPGQTRALPLKLTLLPEGEELISLTQKPARAMARMHEAAFIGWVRPGDECVSPGSQSQQQA